MKTLFMLLVFTAAAFAQCVECNNPNNPAEDCGQCCVTGKECQPANGRCPDPTCQWCSKIVRTEFCGIFILAPACWCFALNSSVNYEVPFMNLTPGPINNSALRLMLNMRVPTAVRAQHINSVEIKNRFWWKR